MLKKKIDEIPGVKEYIRSERIKGLIEGTIFGMIAGVIYVVTIVGNMLEKMAEISTKSQIDVSQLLTHKLSGVMFILFMIIIGMTIIHEIVVPYLVHTANDICLESDSMSIK